jgi:dolichol-phosphate mannosyltransferase
MKLSVVIPVCNEAENVAPLAREIQAALAAHRPFEIIFVDDGSTDTTAAAACAARDGGIPEIRLLQHSRRSGQSAAVWTGVRAARADWIATLDGDGQNDPADIPAMLEALRSGEESLRLIMGNRSANRRDTWLRKVSSRVANEVRGRILRDGTPDTGCGIKLLHRATFLELPRFNHMHRFLPALFLMSGWRIASVPVNDRSRRHGRSHYGLFDRLWIGIVDLAGVLWLQRRVIRAVPLGETHDP